jgi:sugar transferase EpsL
MTYAGKRTVDIVVILATAVLWLPLLLVTGIFVRVFMGAPILFKQQRVGLNDRSFELLKFRTMTDPRSADGRMLPDSQRLSRIGRALRSSSLDELPQLINVLRGEMSLVGPRPLLPEYLALYTSEHRRRHTVRPGLTGLAQVSGRNALSWPDRLDLDIRYVDTCSIWNDLTILVRTVGVGLLHRGVAESGMATMTPFAGYEPRRPDSCERSRSCDPDQRP